MSGCFRFQLPRTSMQRELSVSRGTAGLGGIRLAKSYVVCILVFNFLAVIPNSFAAHSEMSGTPSFTVSGSLKVHALTWEAMLAGEFSPIRSTDEYAFTVASDSCRWSITIRPIRVAPPDLEDAPPGSRPLPDGWMITAASDGEDFCVLRTGPRPAGLAYAAYRGPGSEPFAVDNQVLALWYAYASHCALAKRNDGLLVPLERLSLESLTGTAGRAPGTLRLFAAPPRLPEEVTLLGYTQQSVHSSPQTGLTNTMLQVSVTTNVHGLTLPLSIKVYYKWVTQQQGKVRTQSGQFMEIETLTIQPGAEFEEYPPPLEGEYSILDYRHWRGSLMGVVSQLTTNGWTRNVGALASARRTQSNSLDRQSRRMFVVLLLAAMVAVPAAFIFSRFRQPTSSITTQREEK